MIPALAIPFALATGAPALAQTATEPYQPETCTFDMDQGVFRMATLGTRTVAAGEKIDFTIYYSRYPSDFNDVPVACLSGWKLSPAVATLANDRRSLTVATTARAGTIFTLTYRYRGKPHVQKFEVIDPVKSPLTGFWTQEHVAACPADQQVYDLVFNRDGSFGLMFGPNIGYRKDLTGNWRVDGDRVILSAIAGEKPADFNGEARFTLGADGGLTFDRPLAGTQGARGTCSAPFRKVR
jgi:hypothetical protein